jgi:hypothetical protein
MNLFKPGDVIQYTRYGKPDNHFLLIVGVDTFRYYFKIHKTSYLFSEEILKKTESAVIDDLHLHYSFYGKLTNYNALWNKINAA